MNGLGDTNGVIGEEKEQESRNSSIAFLFQYFDFREFAKSAILAVSFAAAVMFPYILAQPDFLNYWSLALGSFSFNNNYVDPIPYNVPVTLPVLPIMYHMPLFAEFLDIVIRSQGPLVFGIVVFAGLMLLLDKYRGEEHMYLRRILFFTMLLMFWTTLTGARGVFKYYFALFGPFFSIFSSARMTRGKGEKVPFSLSMIWMPVLFSLLILIPDRNYYLGYVIMIFVSYALSPVLDRAYHEVKRPFGYLRSVVASRLKTRLETIRHGETPHQSRRYRFLNWITVIFSIVAGPTLIILGVSFCFAHITASLEVILQFILLMGAMVFVGTQITSIATNGLQTGKERINDLNYVMMTLSYTMAALLFIFGFDTYALSWTVSSFVERQQMIFSSMFIIIWVFGLVVLVKKKTRFLSVSFLFVGSVTATWIWFLLGDTLFYLFGCTLIVGLVLLILLTVSGAPDDLILEDYFSDIAELPGKDQLMV